MATNKQYSTVISIDKRGMIEYWDINNYNFPNTTTTDSNPRLQFTMKSETDLYELVKQRITAWNVSVSHRGEEFVLYCRDKKIRVFNFRRGKITRIYDESIEVYSKGLQGNQSEKSEEEVHLAKRIVTERELEETVNNNNTSNNNSNNSVSNALSYNNILFDASDHFILFATLKGS